MDCFTPKRGENDPIPNQDVCFKTLNKLTTAISTSPRAPTIRDFAIIKPISRGAFGKVFLGYKGTDSATLFAIKVMRKSDMINKNMISQVITERNALALSRSPYCVTLFYSLQTASFIYLVMEYMVGGDLKSLLAVTGYFDEPAARFYCAEVTLALQYLHGHGIVHRDIKPDNMLVSHSGHVKLTDFGLSKIELSRDLEMSDLINCSPSLNARTPGQLLSLTSHLSFGSCEKKGGGGGGGSGSLGANSSQITSNLMQAMNRQKSPDHEQELDMSVQPNDDSHVSGVSPFQSAEDINVSFGGDQNKAANNQTDSASSYYTCNSSVGVSRTSSSESFKCNGPTASSLSYNTAGSSLCTSSSASSSSGSGSGSGTASHPQPLAAAAAAAAGATSKVNRQLHCGPPQAQKPQQQQLLASVLAFGGCGLGKENSSCLSNETMASTTAANDSVGGTFDLSMKSNAAHQKEASEDSGVSSRKSELSAHIHCELSAIERPDGRGRAGSVSSSSSSSHQLHHHHHHQQQLQHQQHQQHNHTGNSSASTGCGQLSKDDYSQTSSLDFSKSQCSHCSPCSAAPTGSTDSPEPPKCFKRPSCLQVSIKRKRSLASRVDVDSSSASTGLTQEIDIMDIGSSTPKKRKAKSPLKGVLKVRSLSDDELPTNEHLNLGGCGGGTVMFSTPVSSQKAPRGGLLKLKSTRFALPSSADVSMSGGGGGGGPPAFRSAAKAAAMSGGAGQQQQQQLGGAGQQHQQQQTMSPINAGSCSAMAGEGGGGGMPQVTPKNMQTPYRTPKSVRRVDGHGHQRILGTPDYLSPELLLAQGHGPEVDWWALGVCLYEFMTGVPPFNDETPQKVFDNILSRNIEYPEGDEALSDEAVDAVEQFLTMDPQQRPTAVQVLQMPFFATLNWQEMAEMEPPFVPRPDNPTDTGYFEARNVMQHLKLSSFDLEE